MASQLIKILKDKYAVEQEQKNFSNEIAREAYTKSHSYRKLRMDYKDANNMVRCGEKTPLNQLIKWC